MDLSTVIKTAIGAVSRIFVVEWTGAEGAALAAAAVMVKHIRSPK